MAIGSFTFVLHSHLPYCRKAGVWPFGEEWVFEAMAETYLPVLNILNDLLEEDSRKDPKVKLSIGLTPVLMEQLADPYMLGRFKEYMEARINAAERDLERFTDLREARMCNLAGFYKDRYHGILRSFEDRYGGDIIGAFRDLQDTGLIEIVTSAATHAYLPLLSTDSSVYAQIKVGKDTYERHFKRRPRGIWLPECAYRPGRGGKGKGIEAILELLDIEYFFVDTHAIQGGRPAGIYSTPASQGLCLDTNLEKKDNVMGKGEREAGRKEETITAAPGKTGRTTYLPYKLEGSNVAVFGRDERTGVQVWSEEWGYPGHGTYREFHKRDSESGFPYWKVTSRLVDLGGKEIYNPWDARNQAHEQAEHFTNLVERLVSEFYQETGKHGIIVAPYDIELFGHWWFEGLDWLREVLIRLSQSDLVELTTVSEYLQSYPPEETIELPECSWGLGGKHYIWANPDTEWLWDGVYEAEAIMGRFSSAGVAPSGLRRRILNQAARELLLLESSDWPFLITTGQARDYAIKRFLEHKERFERLIHALGDGIMQSDESFRMFLDYLADVEERDCVFPGAECSVFHMLDNSRALESF